LFWRHGCSAARNSPACKGKSLRCLRKCRFAYIDTSPAVSARRHLTAALRPSRFCQTHQTCALPDVSEPSPDGSTAEVLLIGSAHPIQNVCRELQLRRIRKARPTAAHGTDWNRTKGGAFIAQVEGRLHCKFEVKRQKTSASSSREPPSRRASRLPTPPNAPPIRPKPAPTERYSKQSPLGLVRY
jgi:hypothetical protein